MPNILTIEKRPLVTTAVSGGTFSQQYHLLRKKEGRICTDEELLLLPNVMPGHIHYNEWQLRKKSCNRLLKYLQQKQPSLKILEVGCGNGWLSAQMAALNNTIVTGIDINTEEIKQAKRVFTGKDNLNFISGTLQHSLPPDQLFDVIIFAASLQYFPSVKKIIQSALSRLTLMGEVHILDSVFYKKDELPAARLRSKEYFASVNSPQMANFYFHHGRDTLQQFNYTVLYNPFTLINRAIPGRNPFYHFIITAKK